MLILLGLLAADPATIMMKVADEHRAPLREKAPKAADSRYRLDPTIEVQPDGKADALAVTGADCERIGTVFCTSKPRTIYTAAY